jgi:PAS domain S-box-containing protein
MGRNLRKTRILSKKQLNRTAGARPNSKDTLSIKLADFHKITEELHIYKQMVDSANHGFVITDMKGNLLYVNDNFAKMHGYNARELRGKNLKIFHDARQLKYVRAVFDRLLKTGKGLNNEELWRKRRDGTVFPTLTNNWILRDKSGRPAMLCATMVDISELRKREAELAASKNTLEAMLNATNDPVVMMDKDYTIVESNKRAADRLRLSREDLIGRCVWDFIPPKLAAARRKLMNQVKATGKPIIFTDKSKDGIIFSNSCYPLIGSGGEVTGMVLFARDITKQKEMEAGLEESKKTLETMLNATGDLVALTDRDIRIVDVNENMAKSLGFPREKIIGRSAWDFMPPEIAARRRKLAEKMFATGKPVKFIDTNRKGRILEASFNPLTDSDGKIIGKVVVAKDITQHKKAQAELEVGKKTLEAMLNASGEAIAMFDRNMKFVELNERMVDAFGIPREKLIGQYAWDSMPPEAIAFRRPKAEHLLATGKPVTYFDEDKGRNYSISGYPLKGADGKIKGIVVFARDITQEKQAEAEINNYREELFKLRRSSYMDLFSAIIVHHFSQPLTIINVLVEEIVGELEGGSFEKERIIESLKTCLRETQAAGETIKKMREHTGQWIKGRKEHFSPCDVINKVVSSLASKARKAKIKIEVKVPESLPVIAGYRIAFEQIVLIITENAIEAADQKKWYQMVISAKRINRHIELVFSNDCYGIPKENIGKIFEPFYSTKTNRVGKGLGLGLPIVHRILMTMGGEIRVKSARKGATFYVNWPLR